MRRLACASVGAALIFFIALAGPEGRQAKLPPEAIVDKVFSQFTPATPGCAVGVSEGGAVLLRKAYGMADLEHDVPNGPDTIFEAGSVSKQFTAAAVLLLVREGRLSLDDPVRKYVPELPDYGRPLLVRHILQHTSGLRDWGSVEAIAGWPRTTRVYTHAHVLDIVSRQKALNFEPGTNWSYSNTGYNLAAIVVSRVAGRPFPEFCRERIFLPLGMTHTSWRDDFRRIVKGRAIAYDRTESGGYRQDMPFEDVFGNGGLLTTVGDLLKWNENAVEQKVGDAEFLRLELEPGRFNDGRAHDYAMGLFIRSFRGVSEVGHSGSTAGYRAYLARYPKRRLSVAVLCNASSAAAERYAHAVAAAYLGLDAGPAEEGAEGKEPPARVPVPPAVAARAGLYRSALTGMPLTLAVRDGRLIVETADASPVRLTAVGDAKFAAPDGGRSFEFGANGRLVVAGSNGTSEVYERVERWKPTAAEVKALSGRYASGEAETELTVAVSGADLKIARRPDTTLTLQPVYKDAFEAKGLGLIRFRRDGQGRATGLSVTVDRVWDLRFAKVR
jgi:CubicO group peptidase (beta-lactamase class C family)